METDIENISTPSWVSEQVQGYAVCRDGALWRSTWPCPPLPLSFLAKKIHHHIGAHLEPSSKPPPPVHVARPRLHLALGQDRALRCASSVERLRDVLSKPSASGARLRAPLVAADCRAAPLHAPRPDPCSTARRSSERRLLPPPPRSGVPPSEPRPDLGAPMAATSQ
jgi:hypothetical protein